ncbi:MAG: hypothetical protein ACAI44_36690 [Candidatus Sericytochromatia bacterium]
MSWNFSAIYVNSETPERLAAAQEAIGRPLPDDKRFVCYDFMEGEIPEDEQLVELSQEYGEVVFLWINAHSETLQYQHWGEGVRLRLVEKGDHGWGPLEGEPEAWEACMFSRRHELEEMMASDPEQAPDWQAIWDGGVLVEDSFCPFSGAEDVASLVARELKLELFPGKG